MAVMEEEEDEVGGGVWVRWSGAAALTDASDNLSSSGLDGCRAVARHCLGTLLEGLLSNRWSRRADTCSRAPRGGAIFIATDVVSARVLRRLGGEKFAVSPLGERVAVAAGVQRLQLFALLVEPLDSIADSWCVKRAGRCMVHGLGGAGWAGGPKGA